MTIFVVAALLLNAAAIAGLVRFRHRIARLPEPGLWWLAVLGLSIVLSLELARRCLS